MKKNAVLIVFVLAIFLGGCETSKGVAGSLTLGVAKDVKDTWHSLCKVDQWMRDHAW